MNTAIGYARLALGEEASEEQIALFVEVRAHYDLEQFTDAEIAQAIRAFDDDGSIPFEEMNAEQIGVFAKVRANYSSQFTDSRIVQGILEYDGGARESHMYRWVVQVCSAFAKMF